MDTDMNKENSEFTKIDSVKRTLFPHLVDVEEGREMVEKHDYDKSVIGTEIDSKGEQQCEDEDDIGWEEAEEYAGLQPDDLVNCEEEKLAGTPLPDKAYQVPEAIDMSGLLEVTRKLASEQKAALNIIIAYCKGLRQSLLFPPKAPLLIVHGGAGTGKSTLISVISKWAHKLLQLPGDDSDCPYVIRTAPTGMAAANVEGATIHSALKLNFGNNYIPLSDKNRELLCTRFKNVQVLIIDEFSMIKSDQLYQLQLRLCEIKQNDSAFGNICVILFGDLMQLKPIKGKYIFQRKF